MLVSAVLLSEEKILRSWSTKVVTFLYFILGGKCFQYRPEHQWYCLKFLIVFFLTSTEIQRESLKQDAITCFYILLDLSPNNLPSDTAKP
jgi:hypothetical protein